MDDDRILNTPLDFPFTPPSSSSLAPSSDIVMWRDDLGGLDGTAGGGAAVEEEEEGRGEAEEEEEGEGVGSVA